LYPNGHNGFCDDRVIWIFLGFIGYWLAGGDTSVFKKYKR